jgi:hypothetical protein
MSGTAGEIYKFVVVQASIIVRGTGSRFDSIYEIVGASMRLAIMLIVYVPARDLSLVLIAITPVVAVIKDAVTPEI